MPSPRRYSCASHFCVSSSNSSLGDTRFRVERLFDRGDGGVDGDFTVGSYRVRDRITWRENCKSLRCSGVRDACTTWTPSLASSFL
jgi:hypothetical protein